MTMKSVIPNNLRGLRHVVSRPALLHQTFPLGPEKVKLVKSRACSTDSKMGENDQLRFNPIGIQMLSKSLHGQIFKDGADLPPEDLDAKLEAVKSHLKSHDLWEKETTVVSEVEFELPEMYGNNIDEHFRALGEKQSAGYRKKADIVAAGSLPAKPKNWTKAAGWTRYNADGSSTKVDFPDEDGLVFDVEVLVPEGNFPTMATAASPNYWYSWCSHRVIADKCQWFDRVTCDDLIPLDSEQTGWKEKVVIGHNVGFDRSYVKEQYYIKGPKTRFLDTMSMHIAVGGFTGAQRMLWNAKRTGSKSKQVLEIEEKSKMFNKMPVFDWMNVGTLNNLSDVYQLYCQKGPLEKETRNVFVEGTMYDIRQDFQSLMSYCADDVIATHQVFKSLWPSFLERFPHPVTRAGMLQMGSSYLPINANWKRYLNDAEETYSNMQSEVQKMLIKLANDACALMAEEGYKEDPWLWNLDWSTTDFRMKKTPKLSARKQAQIERDRMEKQGKETKEDRINRILSTEELLGKVPNHMPGYPLWFKGLCPKPSEKMVQWSYGPSKISTLMQVTPKLMGLTWDGFPLHYDKKLGWGYLVPGRRDNVNYPQCENKPTFPLKQVLAMFPPPETALNDFEMKQDEEEKLWAEVEKRDLSGEDNQELFKKLAALKNKKKKTKGKPDQDNGPWWHQGEGPYDEVNIPGCWFFKIPHKDGPSKNVGNPLTKDFYSKFQSGILRSHMGTHVNDVLEKSIMCAYWKNSRDRIIQQMAIWLDANHLPPAVTSHPDYYQGTLCGAILPRIVPAGTVTRRAVEKTWLTASNAYEDRIGSELKAMVQCPPGYTFVGADVDSQELWIASVIGDAGFAGMHGSTAFGWMNLQGKKSDGTDLHSKTAQTVGITRDQAKVFNYGRIYGAGYSFAVQLLCQFNPRLTRPEAQKKANVMYTATKGFKEKTTTINENGDEMKTEQWVGGSESEMFNKLERIITGPEPRTPVLGCRISRALEPENVNDGFMTSRLNWVVQSSAVDYLHLMLVCNQWLIDEYNIDGRFCISIHDEVRYLVKSEDKHRAALALQISNLLTRCMFAYKLGINDLPQSVAFFSAVDLDTCLRKEVNLDCKTPSNPRGLEKGYGLPKGEALDIYQILEITKGSLSPQQEVNSGKEDCGQESDDDFNVKAI